jgi:hypothetical protein
MDCRTARNPLFHKEFIPVQSNLSRAVKPFGRIANLAYWVTGTEGSNPSLSATESGV